MQNGTRLIGTPRLEKLMLSGIVIEMYNAIKDQDEDRAREVEQRWWREQGIDPAAINDWALRQAADDIEQAHTVFGNEGLDVAQFGAMLATAWHMGCMMGVRLKGEE